MKQAHTMKQFQSVTNACKTNHEIAYKMHKYTIACFIMDLFWDALFNRFDVISFEKREKKKTAQIKLVGGSWIESTWKWTKNKNNFVYRRLTQMHRFKMSTSEPSDSRLQWPIFLFVFCKVAAEHWRLTKLKEMHTNTLLLKYDSSMEESQFGERARGTWKRKP